MGLRSSFVAIMPKYFFLLGGRRDIFAIISFSFVSIRHHLGVLLFLGIFQNLWPAKELFVSVRPILFIGRWEGYFYYNFIRFVNIRCYLGVLLISGIFEILWAAKDLLWP